MNAGEAMSQHSMSPHSMPAIYTEHEFCRVFSTPVDTASVRELTDEQLRDLLDRLHFDTVAQQPRPGTSWLQWTKDRMAPYRPDDTDSIYGCYVAHKTAIKNMMSVFQKRGLVDYMDERAKPTLTRFESLLNAVHHMYRAHMNMRRMVTKGDGVASLVARLPHKEASLGQLSSVWRNTETMTAYQTTILHVLSALKQAGMRRMGPDCYHEFMFEGKRTCYWRRECTIREFIYRCIDKETCWNEWCVLTSMKNVAESIEKYLTSCVDVEFQSLHPDRTIFAFRNGVYKARENQFLTYDAIRVQERDPPVAVQFIDGDFIAEDATCDDWSDIATPAFDSIFTYQGYDAECIEWALALLGRMLYEVSDLDNWQIGLFFKGVAGSGKSTIINFMRLLYPPHRVGAMSSNGEDKFGLSALYDKLMYVCAEVKEDFTLNQADWQSMISGEDVSIAIKHKVAIAKKWTVPGILCGNELPRWVDAAGSIVRRLVLYDFHQKVIGGDPDLGNKIKALLPSLLCKMNRAYHDKVRVHGKSDIWKPGVLPQKLADVHSNLKSSVVELLAFIEDSGAVRLEPGARMTMKEFERLYRTWRKKENKTTKVTWNRTYYSTTFDDKGIIVDNQATIGSDVATHSGIYLVGVTASGGGSGGGGGSSGGGGGGGGGGDSSENEDLSDCESINGDRGAKRPSDNNDVPQPPRRRARGTGAISWASMKVNVG